MNTIQYLYALRRCGCGVALLSAMLLGACGGGSGGATVVEPPVVAKAWQPAEQVIDQLDTLARGVQVAINADGVGFAVWVQHEGAREHVFASRYSAGVWDAAKSVGVASDSFSAVQAPQIAVHPNGEATAVWVHEGSNGKTDIVVGRYVGGQWTPPNALITQTGEVDSPQIASSANGSAMVVWLQKADAPNARVKTWASFFDGTKFVGQLVNLDSGSGDTSDPQIATNSKGEAVAVWSEKLAGVQRTWTSSFANGEWRAPAEALSESGVNAIAPQIALGDDGQAVAVWTQNKTAQAPSVFASRRDAAGKWAIAEPIETDIPSAFSPQVTMDALGNATVVWEQVNSTFLRDIWANRMSGGIWLGAQKLEADDTGSARGPRVASDNAGNAIAVWSQSDGTRFNTFSSRFDGAQWSAPQLIEQNANDAEAPQIAMTPDGRALAVWTQRTGPNNDPAASVDIAANVFK